MYFHLLPKSGSTKTVSYESRTMFTIQKYYPGEISNFVWAVNVTGFYSPKDTRLSGDTLERHPA